MQRPGGRKSPRGGDGRNPKPARCARNAHNMNVTTFVSDPEAPALSVTVTRIV